MNFVIFKGYAECLPEKRYLNLSFSLFKREIKQKLMLKPRKSFKKELKRQMKYAIAAAVGFLIAFAWRDAVYATVHGVLAKFEETTKFITSEISTASVITVIGVLIIILSSRLLREKR